MILADTSVWVDHLRRREPTLFRLLDMGQVVMHPFVPGEIALGHLPRRDEVLDSLRLLPQTFVASHAEVLDFIDRHPLAGRGIGYVDVHLLAAARLTDGTMLWTRDRSLHSVA